ncbi:uncharacterized protein LOC125660237 [Ostrea edulis]|uniref:uncharacterized protein LOC125660237 n=1 Tax=Ostrea edulis TaxID=37623 RepID=UPI0024AEF589|nr:uncharacterized protein LOC125660237 [Ostrea edulis]
MAILFYVYFEEAYQTATLIQFDGAAGGFELCLKNGVLTAIFFSTDGTRYEHSAPDFHLQSNSWHFIGAEYNNMWGMNDQFDLLHVDVSSGAKEIPRYISTLTESGNIPNIDISGCFRFGQNFLRNSSFKGYMSCLQFYTVSVFSPKDTMRDLYEKCDPSVWTTEWDITADFIPGVSPYCVLNTTTQFVTTESDSTTTQYATTESDSTTTQYVTTESDSTTTQYATTESDPTTTQFVTTESDSTTTQYVTTESDSTTTQYVTTESDSTTTQYATTESDPTTTQYVTTESDSTTTQYATTESDSTTTQYATTESDSTTTQYLTTVEHNTEHSPITHSLMTIKNSQTSPFSAMTWIPFPIHSAVSAGTFEPPIQRCILFEKLSINQSVVSDLWMFTCSTISECLRKCIGDDSCAAVSVQYLNSVIVCSATSDISTAEISSEHVTYSRRL